MKAVLLIFRKEWRSLFTSPVIYLVMSVFFGLMGYMFFGLVTQFELMSMQAERMQGLMGPDDFSLNEVIIRPLYGNSAVLWLLMLPLVTMRLVSEERKQGTFVLLLTSPVKLIHIVAGKFLAGFAFVFLLLFITAIYPLVCVVFGNAGWGPILAANIGMLLMGGIFIALGLLASSLTQSQMLAAVLGFGFILAFWVVDFLSDLGDSLGFLSELSLLSHLDAFMKGIVDTYHLGFYAIFLAAVLFLTHEALRSERWR